MIFIERNDPNQISNLIDYQTGESGIKSNYSSLRSENSDIGNESRLNNSFDKPCYRSVDSQISEYAVQKSIIENNNFLTKSEYESGNSVLNNLQFKSHNKEEEYSSHRKNDHINFLWRRGNENNSQKNMDNSKKSLGSELNQFNENNTNNNKINLSSMLSNNSNISNIKNVKNNKSCAQLASYCI